MKPRHSLFIVFLPLTLAAGCAQPPLPTDAKPDYFADARRCDRQSQITIKTRVNLGGLSETAIPMGADSTQYRICMEGLGWKVEPGKDPYLALAANCRQIAAKPLANASEDIAKRSQIDYIGGLVQLDTRP